MLFSHISMEQLLFFILMGIDVFLSLSCDASVVTDHAAICVVLSIWVIPVLPCAPVRTSSSWKLSCPHSYAGNHGMTAHAGRTGAPLTVFE